MIINRELLTQRFSFFARYENDELRIKKINRSSNKLSKLTAAAVMLVFIERDNELFLLLTKRANHLKHHAGQISFPGGKAEATDKDLIDTAIRETNEEIGLSIKRENILGLLTQI